ncbi:hypothetical protein C7D74_31970, partial [Klebsiella pneumoniae]
DLAVQAQNKAPLDNLRRFLESFTGPVIFSVESGGRREALSEMLARIKVAPKHVLRLEEARRCRTSPSRRRTKRRWIICAASSSPLPVR